MSTESDDFSYLIPSYDDQGSRKKKLLIAPIFVGVLLLTSGIGVTYSYYNGHFTSSASPQSGSDSSDGWQSAGSSEQSGSGFKAPVSEEDQFYIDNPNPEKLQDWQSKYATSQPPEEITAILEDTNLYPMFSSLPSEEHGFTSDVTQEHLEDGSLNPLFSYWTKKSFSSSFIHNTEKLLNPIYGDWSSLQFPDGGEPSIDLTYEVFTTRFLQENSGKPLSEWMPVYGDWNKDSYGGTEFADGTYRWIGKITSGNIEFHNEDNGKQKATGEVDVVFKAWGKDRKQLERAGKLTFTIVPNTENSESNVRILFDDIKLTIG